MLRALETRFVIERPVLIVLGAKRQHLEITAISADVCRLETGLGWNILQPIKDELPTHTHAHTYTHYHRTTEHCVYSEYHQTSEQLVCWWVEHLNSDGAADIMGWDVWARLLSLWTGMLFGGQHHNTIFMVWVTDLLVSPVTTGTCGSLVFCKGFLFLCCVHAAHRVVK